PRPPQRSARRHVLLALGDLRPSRHRRGYRSGGDPRRLREHHAGLDRPHPTRAARRAFRTGGVRAQTLEAGMSAALAFALLFPAAASPRASAAPAVWTISVLDRIGPDSPPRA